MHLILTGYQQFVLTTTVIILYKSIQIPLREHWLLYMYMYVHVHQYNWPTIYEQGVSLTESHFIPSIVNTVSTNY